MQNKTHMQAYMQKHPEKKCNQANLFTIKMLKIGSMSKYAIFEGYLHFFLFPLVNSSVSPYKREYNQFLLN